MLFFTLAEIGSSDKLPPITILANDAQTDIENS
jgi:hypothetical protein